MCIKASSPRKRNGKKGKRTPLATLIQNHAGPIFGKKDDGFARWRNDKVAHLLNLHRNNFWKWTVPLYVINQHDDGLFKLKVSSSLHTEKGRTLVYLDVDTHDGVGDPEDARKLLSVFGERHFPNMPKPVITDRGGSAWLVVETRREYRGG